MKDALGGLGLALLMGAFLAGLSGRLNPKSPIYLFLNGMGGGILAWYSLRLGIWIFVILEGMWSVVAWWSFFRVIMTPHASTIDAR
jgi:hypothetical protein